VLTDDQSTHESRHAMWGGMWDVIEPIYRNSQETCVFDLTLVTPYEIAANSMGVRGTR
jgi:hypothetical protein